MNKASDKTKAQSCNYADNYYGDRVCGCAGKARK